MEHPIPTTRFYGIRHHGPGSARALLEALRRQQPDCILLEMPADAADVLPVAADKRLRPPVAVLIFRRKQPDVAAFYPFTSFSPEWVALRFGLKKNIPVRCMDLPQALHFELAEQQDNGTSSSHFPPPANDSGLQLIQQDPLGTMARLAGYEDVERWWEVSFEHKPTADRFEKISRMITALRRAQPYVSPETSYREAYMRRTIRRAHRDGYQNIAVVCGAWHLPALEELDGFAPEEDERLLKSLKSRHKTDAVWVPWNYDRLTRHQYGAGISSPVWYDLLFRHKGKATIYWMARAARLMRRQDLSVSAPDTIAAVRLAENLAGLRNLGLPGLRELEHAALAVFCGGNDAKWALIHRLMHTGNKQGKVPPTQVATPLQRDLMARIKRARLTKVFHATGRQQKQLDLRLPSHLEASRLLHSLLLLDIPWGHRLKGPRGAVGSFAEYWSLHWKPDYMVRVVEAGMWGRTIAEAAENHVLHRLTLSPQPVEIAALFEQSLFAGLPRAAAAASAALRNALAVSSDVWFMMEVLPGIFGLLRYGSIRQLPAKELNGLIEVVCPRMFSLLPVAAAGVGDGTAEEKFQLLSGMHRALLESGRAKWLESWFEALRLVTESPNHTPFFVGAVFQLLFSQKQVTLPVVLARFGYHLSPAQDSYAAVRWLEGFIGRNGRLLLHYDAMWRAVNAWVMSLSPEAFVRVLPLLRRVFVGFPVAARRKLLWRAARRTEEAAPWHFYPEVWAVAKDLV